MKKIIIAILFLSMASICKSVADTLAHHFGSSVFKHLNPNFWDPNVSWKYAGFFWMTKYRVDAWHLANSGMIIFFILFGLFAQEFKRKYEYLIYFVGCGIIFNLVFNLFYNKVWL